MIRKFKVSDTPRIRAKLGKEGYVDTEDAFGFDEKDDEVLDDLGEADDVQIFVHYTGYPEGYGEEDDDPFGDDGNGRQYVPESDRPEGWEDHVGEYAVDGASVDVLGNEESTVEYQIGPDEATLAGQYGVEFRAIWRDGEDNIVRRKTWPTIGYETIEATPSASASGDVTLLEMSIEYGHVSVETLEADSVDAGEASIGTIQDVEGEIESLGNRTSGLSEDGSEADLQALRTENLDSVRYAAQFEGSTLDQKVDNAINDFPNDRGTVVINPPADGGSWTWDSWEIDPTDYNGITLDVASNTVIAYEGDGTAIKANSGGNIGDQITGSTLNIRGGLWRAQSGDPDSFCHLIDISQAEITPDIVRGFGNDAGDCITFHLENRERWCERNTISGVDIDGADIGFKTEVTDGTRSFVDNRFHQNSIGYRDTGMILNGSPSGMAIRDLALFPREEGSTGILFNGRTRGMVIQNPRCDDTGGASEVEDVTMFATGPDMVSPTVQSGPVIVGGTDAGVDKVVDYHSPDDNIFWQRTDHDQKPVRQIVDRGLYDQGKLEAFLYDDWQDGNLTAREGMVWGSYYNTAGQGVVENAQFRPQWYVREGNPTVEEGALLFESGDEGEIVTRSDFTVGTWQIDLEHVVADAGELVYFYLIRGGVSNWWRLEVGDEGTAGIDGRGRVRIRKEVDGTSESVISENYEFNGGEITATVTREVDGEWTLDINGTTHTGSDDWLPEKRRVGVGTSGPDGEQRVSRILIE